MSKKINKVFLNATAEQIEEYGLEDGVTNFSTMEKLIAAVKADLAKTKIAEKVYNLDNGFTVIDGAADVSVDLKEIAEKYTYKLSAVDFDKIIDAATTVLYTSESIVDHRIASFEAVGEGEIKNLNPQYGNVGTVERNDFPATAAGEKKYEEAVAKHKEAAKRAVTKNNSAIVGYKDLVIENSGIEPAVTETGKGMERVTTIKQPIAVSAIGGDTDINYQYDAVLAVDKKDEKLVVENFTENFGETSVATGSVSVKDSQVNNLKGDVSEQVKELKNLYPGTDFDKLVVADNVAGYETVTIDNSTVLGNITGGSLVKTKTSVGSKDNFLDKQALSGKFYTEATATGQQGNKFSTDNTALFSYVEAFTMTEKDATAKAKELSAKESVAQQIENPTVNKYEISEKGVDGYKATGKYVYLTAGEVASLSDANKARLTQVEDGKFFGRVDYAGRSVTDDNFTTFTKEPTGNQLNNVYVRETIFKKTDGTELGRYYVSGGAEMNVIATALGADTTKTSQTEVYGYRAAAYGTITAENFKTEASADKVYAKYSTVSGYVFVKEMTADAAAEANKALMAEADQKAWIKTATVGDETVLFTVQKVAGGKATTYYLTAEELSNLGAFGKDKDGKNVTKVTDDMLDLTKTVFDASTGWCFVDATSAETRKTIVDTKQLYRTGAAATSETLDQFKTLTDTNSSTVVPYDYKLMDVVYNKGGAAGTLLINENKEAGVSEFASYLGENGEYVIDGEIQYRAVGYNISGNIQDSEHVSSVDKTINKAEYTYSASLTTSLTQAKAESTKGAYPTGGELTQNKFIFEDAYAAAGKTSVTLEKEQDAYTHNFIDVYAAQNEETSIKVLNDGFVGLDTGVQAKDSDGKALYVKYDVANKEFVSTTATEVDNVAVATWKDAMGVIYAVSDDEAAAINIIPETLKKCTGAELKQYYRSYTAGAATLANYGDYKVTALNEYGALYSFETANATTKLDACNKVTAIYDAQQPFADPTVGYSARLTVKVGDEEKDAFFNSVTKTLTADDKATYNAIYVYTKDANTYYMTEAEAKLATGATKGAQATDADGKYMFRITEGTSTKLADYAVKYANYFVDGTAAATKEVEFDEAWYSEWYVIGEQVYKYTKTGDQNTYYMTETEATNVGGDLTKGDAVEGDVHYGKLAKDWDKLDSYKVAGTRILDTFGGDGTITKDADGKALQAVAEGGEIYSNIGAAQFGGITGTKFEKTYVYDQAIDAEATYYYTVETKKSYSDEELALLKKNEEAAGIATWEQSIDKNGLITWTRTSATGEVSIYEADYANVKTADKSVENVTKLATGSAIIKNGSAVKGAISGYAEVTVNDSKVGAVTANNYANVTTSDFSTKKGKIDKLNQQTITTTEKKDSASVESAIGSFTLANAKDRLAADGKTIESSTGAVAGYETVKITNANVGNFTATADDLKKKGAYETKSTSKQVIDYTGDADDLRANYINDWQTLANTGREGTTGAASYVVSKITSETNEEKTKTYAVGSFEATGRDYKFTVSDKIRANTIGSVSGYDQVTLTNVNAGAIDSGSQSETMSKESYTVKSNAKTGKDLATNTGNRKTVNDSDGILVAENSVTDAKNENDLTITSIRGYQAVSLTNVGVGTGGIVSTQKSATISSGSVTKQFDASTLRKTNISGRQYVGGAKVSWSDSLSAQAQTWDWNSDKTTSSKQTTSTVSTPDAVLEAKGQFSTKAVENEATLNKYTQASTGRELYLTEAEAKNLIGDASTESGLKAGWTKDAKQVYLRNSDVGTVLGKAELTALDGTTATAKYWNGTDYCFFTADEAKIAKLADSKWELVTGADASSRLRTAGKQEVSGDGTATEADIKHITGTIEVHMYVKAGESAVYLTDKEWEDGKVAGGPYEGFTKNGDNVFVRRADAGEDKSQYGCFWKTGHQVSSIYTYTNKLDASDVRYVTENEFKILVANGDIVADDYTKSEKSVYRQDDYAKGDVGEAPSYKPVAVNNSACTDGNNAFAAQAISTVFKYTNGKTGAEAKSYYLTAEEFATLSAKGKTLEGYTLDEKHSAMLVMRNEATKAALADGSNIDQFIINGEGVLLQGTRISEAEYHRTDLTDEEAKAFGITYDETMLRCYSANEVDEWADAVKTTVKGEILNFKTVTLDTMNVTGKIDNGHDTKSNSTGSYSKKVSSKKGSDIYTEASSTTRNTVKSAVGSIDLVDTDVTGSVTGYDKVSISTTEGNTSTIGGVSKTYYTNKHTSNTSVKTTDATAYFSQEMTTKNTDVTTYDAKGTLEVAGLRAAEDLVIDQSKHFDTVGEAEAEAGEQIKAFGEKKDADIRITGNIKGFKNVSLTNVTISGSEIDAYGDKSVSNTSKTTYSLTNNDKDKVKSAYQVGNTMKVVSGLNKSSSSNNTIGGNLELVNVNQAVTYTASSKAEETADAAKVNTYLYNGKYYALTGDEKAALLPNAVATTGVNQARLNESVKKPATVVNEGQSILTVTNDGKATLANDGVYYKTSKVVDPDAATKTYYYIKAESVNEWLEKTPGETVDTSKAYYAKTTEDATITEDKLLTANVSKYTYNDTTVYLTAAEADILGAKATTDTAKYTRCNATAAAVTYAPAGAMEKTDDGLVDVCKYVGTVMNGDEAVVKEYYLTANEFTGFTAGTNPVLNSTFAKVDGTTYQRNVAAQTVFKKDNLDAIDAATIAYGKVNLYSSDGTLAGTQLYASEAEFAQLQKLDAATYKDYKKVDTGTKAYYLLAESIFNKTIDPKNLNDYQAVNESAEVYEVTNDYNGAVIGYLTKAEYYTLRDNAAAGAEAFEDIYSLGVTKFLRVADDKNNLITINGVEGEGYVVAAADTLKPFSYNVADKTDSLASTVAKGFKTITMTDSELSGAEGYLETTKITENLTSKKGDLDGKYSATSNGTTKNNVGTFTAVDGVNNVYGDVVGYKTVTLAGELDKEGKSLSTFGGFKSGTGVYKYSCSGKVALKDGDYTVIDEYDEYENLVKLHDIYDGKVSSQGVETADGTFVASNVTLGDIQNFKNVTVSFDETEDKDVLKKHKVGCITGGNTDMKVTSTIKTVGGVRVTDSTTTRKLTSVGTANVAYAYADSFEINGFANVNVIGSEVGDVKGGNSVNKTIELAMTKLDGKYYKTTTSSDTVHEVSAVGTATLAKSKAASVTGFKKVAFVGGVEVAGEVSASVDNYEENSSRGVDNTVCYAVTYDYNYVDKKYNKFVYLTVDEYKVFVKDEKYADAQIDLSVSTYRSTGNEDLTMTAEAMAAKHTWSTEASKRNTDYKGYNGANPEEIIVKVNGQDFSIDEFGAKIGGEVKGYLKVTVDGDSSFGGGYEGTNKADKLVVNADLATFGKLDFGEGKDTLELNGTFGTDVEFKDWNLEEVKVAKNATGTMVVKSDDAAAVKALFADVEVYGSDNYSKASALEGLTMDDAKNLGTAEEKEWLGFCDEVDYFAAQNGGNLNLDGEIFDKGFATAKVSYDEGDTWTTVKDGDKIFAGADIKVFLDEGANKVSNDYTISIANPPA